jgi:hypothetical protein
VNLDEKVRLAATMGFERDDTHFRISPYMDRALASWFILASYSTARNEAAHYRNIGKQYVIAKRWADMIGR